MAKTKRTTTRKKAPVAAAGADDLLPRLESVLRLSGMSQTKFGYEHFGDPTFMSKLRKGRQLYKLRGKALELIEEYGV